MSGTQQLFNYIITLIVPILPCPPQPIKPPIRCLQSNEHITIFLFLKKLGSIVVFVTPFFSSIANDLLQHSPDLVSNMINRMRSC